jgi:hypothetical protein
MQRRALWSPDSSIVTSVEIILEKERERGVPEFCSELGFCELWMRRGEQQWMKRGELLWMRRGELLLLLKTPLPFILQEP